MLSFQQGVQVINDFVGKNGGDFGKWYIGIAKDPKDRLHNGHNVLEHYMDVYNWWQMSSISVARTVESHFMEQGMFGGKGGGDNESTFVYVYEIQPYTKQ